MKAFRFIFKDWVFGILLTLIVLGAFSLEFYPLLRLDYLAYDTMSRLKKRETTRDVVIVAIDDESIGSIGSWPWPRMYIADALDRLSSYGPKVIGVDLFFAEKEPTPVLAEVRKVTGGLKEAKSGALRKVFRSLKETEKKIDGDRRLVSSVKSSGRVILPLFFTTSERGEEAASIPGFLKKNSAVIDSPPASIATVKADILSLKNPLATILNGKLQATSVEHPFEELASAARALGHSNHAPDDDGTVRREPLLIRYRDRGYPSLALQVALTYLKEDINSITGLEVADGAWGLSIGKLNIPADSTYRMLANFAGTDDVPTLSLSHVMEGKVRGKELRGKAVLLGYTGAGAMVHETPSGESLTSVEMTAKIVDNIIRGDQVLRPAWAYGIEVLVIAYFGIFVSFILPRVGLRVGALLIVLSLLPPFVAAAYLLITFGYWVMLFSPGVLLLAGYLSIVSREYVSIGKKSSAEADTIETNKMLGLSFQNQGMLDLALEKFMRCPVRDESVKGLLYNLALDFERKRMHAKAKAVYEHILTTGRFKDAKKRAINLGKAEGAATIGADASSRGTTVVKGGLGENPTLGRYEILRELGRGSMGMVFLGRDPKINREVAIKTLVYGDVEEDQLAGVKKRFFQEAEAAGRLSHPNIMTIYDAGEEYDMAYMAMELLQGRDLRAHCTRGKLLPIKEVMRIMADVADALDYAQRNGVIHRDIKPANIMLLGDGTVKVTDFGIARIVEYSTTHTKMIQGTPSYMSPEQVGGEKVQGPSDLFSLGAVFYELLSGKKAFSGEGVSSIMYSISKGEYVPLSKVAKKIPRRLDSIVKKLLAKDVRKRYKRGADVAKDIRVLMGEKF